MAIPKKQNVLDLDNHVFVVAEIGKNFIQTEKDQPVSVYLKNSKKLVDEAVKAGADAVKFQTHSLDEHFNITVTSPHFKSEDRLNWIKRNVKATPYETFWKPLKAYCDKKGILFFSTPMSKDSAVLLSKLKPEIWKVGSADILDFPLLEYLASTGKPIIISTGMSTMPEVSKAIKFIRDMGTEPVILHCVSKYPCPPEELNLKTIEFLKNKFKTTVGFSDHSLSTETAEAAIYQGARVIEKHFSLDRSFWGPDHKVSLTPAEFKEMVSAVRRAEKAKSKMPVKFNKYLGKSGKVLRTEEKLFRPIFRKSLAAFKDIKKGTTITAEHLTGSRPQKTDGIPSQDLDKVLGKVVSCDISRGEALKPQMLK